MKNNLSVRKIKLSVLENLEGSKKNGQATTNALLARLSFMQSIRGDASDWIIRGELNHMDALLFAEFESEVFQFEFLNLTTACHGEFLDEEDVAGDFVAGDFAGAEFAHIEVGHLYAFVEDDEGTHFFAVAL